MQNIFVYGTLKRGQQRASVLADQQFLGDATTTKQYAMYDLGNYPGLVSIGNGVVDDSVDSVDSEMGDLISGEVYRVDPACRRLLDEIEAVDAGLYELKLIDLQDFDEEPSIWSYFYLGDVAGCQRIVSW